MNLDDAELIARSKQGNLSAFNTIVERYQGQVYNVAARILRDRTAAEDIAQETFISAHRALESYRGGSFRAWLLRIASNQSYDYLRSAKRRPAQSLDENAENNPGFAVPSDDPGPEELALQGELQETIQRAIVALPLDQRTVLVYIDVQGMSYDETAEATGVSIGTVKSRLSRARARVRDLLLEHRELLPEQFRQIQ